MPPEVLRDMRCGPHRGPRRCRAAIEAKASLLATLSEVHTRDLPFDVFTNPPLEPFGSTAVASAPAAPPKATLIKSHEEGRRLPWCRHLRAELSAFQVSVRSKLSILLQDLSCSELLGLLASFLASAQPESSKNLH